MKTSKSLFYLCFAWALMLCSCQEHIELEGSLLKGEIDEHPYAVFLEAMDVDEDGATSFSGHYLDLSSFSADTVPFNIFINKKTIRVQAEDAREQSSVKDRSLSMLNKNLRLSSFHYDDKKIEGKIGVGLFVPKVPFRFDICQVQPFVQYSNKRYRKPCYRVSVEKDVPYGQVKGYWAEIPEGEDKGFDLIRKLREVGEEQDLELTMDIYKPQHDALKHRPLIMMIHGGAFYLGAKDSPNYVKWCEHLSSLGYVVASINYRLGFKLNLSAIERSAYCAVQDAHAAMRFLVEERETYGIDTSMIFVGGSSAGAITSLNLAYMTEAYRPVTSFDDEERDLPDLGPINKSGNRCKADFDIKGVVNMWGAVSNLEMFDAKKVPILSFHGDKDDIVPYKYDYPFKAVGAFKKTLFNKMYGSYNIQQRAEANRIPAELHTFKGWKHEPQVDKNDSINDNFYLIQDKMDVFFRDIVAPVKPAIVASKEEEGCYYVRPANAESVSWEVEGGFVTEQNGNEIKVVWISNAPRRYLRVSGKLPYDYGFVERRNINLKNNG